MTIADPQILIRHCDGFEEYEACVRLQIEIWGYDLRDTVPTRELVVVRRIGGQIVGAFDLAKSSQPQGDAGGLIGFAMSMPGIREGEAYLHSHMLAVLPEYRNRGIGRKLKMAQREDALARGIRKMEWTFDPLVTKNAYLNLVRLGVVVHSYSPNFYGVFSSRLQGGLPTDRLHAEWWMDSPRVQTALSGGTVELPEIQETIVVLGEILRWKEFESDFARAEAAQREIRSRFQAAFSRGLTVVGFTRQAGTESAEALWNKSEDTDGVYLLANWREA